ncbi:MAG: response regulator transcription factor [Candidatus Latescibacterota bacterium]|nr:MAG: response regulator transcription factor [Candidatus Latescibacterota bacterium]
MSVRILLAEDHKLVRQALKTLLEPEEDLELVGETGDGMDVMEQVAKHRPDILVLDLMMPGLNGLEVTRRVHQRFPKTRVLVLSMHQDRNYVSKAVQNGASGYVVKHADADDLLRGIRHVAAGRRFFSAPISEWPPESLEPLSSESLDLYDTLTPREKEVLQLVAEGHKNAEIAKLLFRSARTVETHRAHIMGKLGLKNPTDLIRFAIEHGLIPVSPVSVPETEDGSNDGGESSP